MNRPDFTKEKGFPRLPKWAQRAIEALQGHVDHLADTLTTVKSPVKTNTQSMIFGTGDVPVNLPNNCIIRFNLRDNQVIEVRVEDTYSREEGPFVGTHLYVYSSTGSLVVRPTSSNVVRITTDARWT